MYGFIQRTQNSLRKNEKYFKKSEWTYNNYSLVAKIVRKRICFKSHFQCPKPSKSHTLSVWNVTVTLWTFTLWTISSVDIHTFTLQLHLQASDYCFYRLNRKCFQYTSSLGLNKGCSYFYFTRRKLLQGRNFATFQRKCVLCPKSDSQCQVSIWKKLRVQYVGCRAVLIE